MQLFVILDHFKLCPNLTCIGLKPQNKCVNNLIQQALHLYRTKDKHLNSQNSLIILTQGITNHTKVSSVIRNTHSLNSKSHPV